MNEGFLGRHEFGGERAATDNHPPVIHYLPLDASVTSALAVGTLMKKVEITETEGEGDSAVTKTVGIAYAPYLSTDTDAPCAVVDLPCDPTGERGEVSACCIVHGTVKRRLLVTGDGKEPTTIQLAQLAERGVFAV